MKSLEVQDHIITHRTHCVPRFDFPYVKLTRTPYALTCSTATCTISCCKLPLHFCSKCAPAPEIDVSRSTCWNANWLHVQIRSYLQCRCSALQTWLNFHHSFIFWWSCLQTLTLLDHSRNGHLSNWTHSKRSIQKHHSTHLGHDHHSPQQDLQWLFRRGIPHPDSRGAIAILLLVPALPHLPWARFSEHFLLAKD